MRRIAFTLFFCFFIVGLFAQKQYKITYTRSFNGKPQNNDDPIWVFVSGDKTFVTSEGNMKLKKYPYEDSYINRKTKAYYQQTFFADNNSIVTVDNDYQKDYQYSLTNDTKKILGYNCKKAVTIVKSNTIELWYTNDLKVKGAPSDALRVQGAPSKIGQELGLVLEMSRNGNFITLAQKIEEVKEWPQQGEIPTKAAVDLLTYEDLLWKSRFVNISIFQHDTLNFYGEHPPYTNKEGVLRASRGTTIAKKIKFPEIKPGSRLFIDVTQFSNGDAYDRTGSLFIIPESEVNYVDALHQNSLSKLPVSTHNNKSYTGMISTANFTAPIELVRFFTPFGVGAYNHYALKGKIWQDSVLYRQDISDLADELSGKEVWIGASIENYDKGGHVISANVTIHPGGSAEKHPRVVSLINTLGIMTSIGQNYPTLFEDEKGVVIDFQLEKDMKDVKFRYTTTGHGGWGGGDEFVPKLNTVFLNDKEILQFTPWRSDCGSFRLSNPSSGNFQNGLSSSDLSRSNWCPGSVTSPAYEFLGDLKAGNYQLKIVIPQGKPEGSSFSAWTVAGYLIGFE